MSSFLPGVTTLTAGQVTAATVVPLSKAAARNEAALSVIFGDIGGLSISGSDLTYALGTGGAISWNGDTALKRQAAGVARVDSASTGILTLDSTGKVVVLPPGSGAGNAATLQASAAVSGNTNGGDINLTVGAKSGSGNLGRVLASGPIYATNATDTSLAYSFIADTTTGIRYFGNSMIFYAGGVESVYFTGVDLFVRGSGKLGFEATTATSTQDTYFTRLAAGVFGTNSWLQNTGGRARTTAQFDATTTTLANITGLSVTLIAGRTYKFIASLPVTADAVGGYKVAMAGTCTATTIYYDVIVEANGIAPSISRQSALAGAASGTLGTTVRIWIEGVITVNAAGTLVVQFSQSTANGTSSVLVGADLSVEDVP